MTLDIGQLVGSLILDDEFTGALEGAIGSLDAIDGKFQKFYSSVGSAAVGIGGALTAGITLPIVGLGAAALTSSIQFESAFAGVRKTVDATEAEFAQLRGEFRDMAAETGVSTTAILGVAEAAGQLGIKKDDVSEFTRVMVDLGETTNLTADEAATATAQIQNIFGAAGQDVDRFGATLVELGNNSATSERQIISMAARIAGAGNQVGLSQAEVLSFAAALSSVGVEADAGGTAISRTFLTINDAVMGGGAALAEFARIAGMATSEFKARFQTDAAGATAAFISGLKRIKGEGENVSEVLGNLELGEIRVRDALLRGSGAAEMFNETLSLGRDAWEDNNALTEEAGKRYATTERELAKLWERLKGAATTLGDSFLPALNGMIDASTPVIDFLQSAAEWFGELPTSMQLTIVGLAGIAAAAGPVIAGLGFMIQGFAAWGPLLAAVGGQAFFAEGAVGLLSGAFGLLGKSIAVIGAFQVGLWIGGWLNEIDSLRHGVENLIATMGEWIGLLPEGTAKQLALDQAMEDQLPTVKEATPLYKKFGDEQKHAAIEAQGLADAAGVAHGPVAGLGERVSHAKTEAEKAAEAFKKLRDQIAGTDLIQSAQNLTRILGEQGFAAKLTGDEVGKYRDQLVDAIRKIQASGAEASPEMLALAMHLDDVDLKSKDAYNGLLFLAQGIDTRVRPSARGLTDELNTMSQKLLGLGHAQGTILVPFAPTIDQKKTKEAGESLSSQLGDYLQNGLSKTIIGALQGGGNVGKSVGGELGSILGSNLAKSASGFLTSHLGQSLGGAVGSIIPGLGTIAGSAIGGLISSGIGKLFGGKNEHKQVNDLRDQFVAAAGGIGALNVKAHEAGLTLDRLLAAKKVKDFQAAVAELEGAFGHQTAQIDLARQAMEEFGIPIERAGQAFKQSEIDMSASSMLEKIDALIASGVDFATIVEFAGDDVGAFIKRAQLLGTKVPLEFKRIAEAMLENGTLIDENGDKLESLGDVQWADTLSGKFDKLIDRLDAFLGKLEKVPSSLDIQIDFTPGDYNFETTDGYTPMASGGVVDQPTRILAGEAGPEAIIPLDRLDRMRASDREDVASEVRSMHRTLERLMVQLPNSSARALRDALRGAAVTR